MAKQSSLFGRSNTPPLAERMRPRTLDEFCGQQHLLGPGKALRVMIETDRIPSLIFWGPPGCGKTTLAHILANETKARFVFFSAIMAGVKEVREIFKEAEERASRGGAPSCLWMRSTVSTRPSRTPFCRPWKRDW